jgi:hypothetical protein
MIGNMVIQTGGSRGDDDSASGIYETDATTMADPASQVSVSTGSADTTSASTPTTVVTTNKSKNIFRSSSGLSDDDSGIYTAYNASMTKEERFRASVLAEERRILKEYSMESGSFGSFPDGLLLPTTSITAKIPSQDKKKNQETKVPPFDSSVGTNDFDLDTIASDGSIGGGRFQVLGIKSMNASSPRGTEEAGAAALSSSDDDNDSPDLVQAEDGYAGRSRAAKVIPSKAKKGAAVAVTSQMRPRVCGCRLEFIICVLASVVAIAIAVAVGAFIAFDDKSVPPG